MIRLGDTSYWLTVSPDGAAWIVLQKTKGRRAKTEQLGRYTSPKHALQCRAAIKLPKEAVDALKEMVWAMDLGEDVLEELPGEPPM